MKLPISTHASSHHSFEKLCRLSAVQPVYFTLMRLTLSKVLTDAQNKIHTEYYTMSFSFSF